MSGNGDNDEDSNENEDHSIDADFEIDVADDDLGHMDDHDSIDGKSKPSHSSSPSTSLGYCHTFPGIDDDDNDEKSEVCSIIFY